MKILYRPNLFKHELSRQKYPKVSGLFSANFRVVILIDEGLPKTPRGWEPHLNNRKNICKLFMSKTRIVEIISAVLFLFSRKERKMKHDFYCRTSHNHMLSE